MLGITHAGTSNQRGFTLIEMSIVLVIIGLIIGGILKGQEIIESSRQKNVVTQIDAIRSAINTFADKYNALPGDYGLASTRVAGSLTDGDDSGIIGDGSITGMTNLNGAGGNAGENVDFWNHLAGAALLSGTTIGGGTAAFGDTNALPSVAIPGAGMTMVYGNHDLNTNDPRRTHWLRVHKNVGTALANNETTGAFSGKTMFQIDLKIDDASGVDGTMRGAGAGDTTCYNATGAYVALGTQQSCPAYFELIQ